MLFLSKCCYENFSGVKKKKKKKVEVEVVVSVILVCELYKYLV